MILLGPTVFRTRIKKCKNTNDKLLKLLIFVAL